MIFIPSQEESVKKCFICNEEKLVASILSVCKDCLKKRTTKVAELIMNAHKRARSPYNLPVTAPDNDRISCSLCNHNCGIDENETSYCGLRFRDNNAKISTYSTKEMGLLHNYLDPLPCNCCAAWFCPAGTGDGYPEYASSQGKELGFYNLSIFFYGCSFDCLFCQNHNHKKINDGTKVSASHLVQKFQNNPKINCICFFGGSPEPQFPFALNVSEQILEIAKTENRIARICWEWNGFGNKHYIKKAATLSLKSGGNIKFDLKAWDSNIHQALTGVKNEVVLENFSYVGREFFDLRPNLPILNATTLLVPGYVDEVEVESIASFISSINENIPYSLLGFYPQFEFSDLPLTTLDLAEKCYKVASKYLKNVNIGNRHLLF